MFLLPRGLGAADTTTGQSTGTGTFCFNFDNVVYYNSTVLYEELVRRAQREKEWGDLDIFNTQLTKINQNLNALYSVFEREGIVIDSAEKSAKRAGISTANAIAQIQYKYKETILTPRGLIVGSGVLDEPTRKFLNQKYGCIGKAVIDLTNPNGATVKARGEVLPIKWTASRIPNTATLNISYMRADGTGQTTFATTTISNGAGTYNWTIPNTIVTGSYKVQLSISGSVKSDTSAKSFEIREKALELLTQNSTETYTVGQKVSVQWKTSAQIKPTDSLTLRLVSATTTANASPAIYDIADVKNTGSYTWVVTETIGGRTVANGNSYKLQLIAKDGSNLSSTSNSAFTIARFVRQIVVKTPNGGETVGANGSFDIVWTANGIDASVKKMYVNLIDTVTNKTALIKEVAPSTNSVTFTVPVNGVLGSTNGIVGIGTYETARYKIQVQAVGNEPLFTDSSDTSFSIRRTNVSVSVTKPATGAKLEIGSTLRVEWTVSNISATTPNAVVEVLNASGATVQVLSTGSTKLLSKAVETKLSAGVVAGTYKVRLSATLPDGSTIQAESPAFEVTNKLPVVTVDQPNAVDTVLKINKSTQIKWTSRNVPSNIGSYEVNLVDTASSTTQRITSVGSNANSTNWIPPLNGVLGTGTGKIVGIGDSTVKKYKIEVRMFNTAGTLVTSDQSDTAFAITR